MKATGASFRHFPVICSDKGEKEAAPHNTKPMEREELSSPLVWAGLNAKRTLSLCARAHLALCSFISLVLALCSVWIETVMFSQASARCKGMQDE